VAWQPCPPPPLSQLGLASGFEKASLSKFEVVPASPGCSSPLLSPLSNDDLDDFLALKCNEIGDVEAAVAEFKMPQAEEVRKWLVMEEPEMHEANFIWTLHHHEDFPTLDTSTADLDRSLNVEMTDVPETLTALGLAEFLKAEKRKTNNKCCKKSRDKKRQEDVEKGLELEHLERRNIQLRAVERRLLAKKQRIQKIYLGLIATGRIKLKY